MARKLKTFITNLGFFELAVAAPSMKAALEAWGMTHNAFQHGFAKQTDDADIIAATQAKPGVVLRRPVGSDEAFRESAELPKTLPALKPPRMERAAARKKTGKPAQAPAKQDRAAVISFEKERAKRQKQRAKEEAALEKEQARRKRATEKVQTAFEKGRARHEAALAQLAEERDNLDRREERENDRWEDERRRLKAEMDRTAR